MPKRAHIIVGVHVHNRTKQVPEVQRVLSEFGSIIRTRLGLHEVDDKGEAAAGIIILELIGTAAAADHLMRQLRKCRGVQVKKLVFAHR